MARKHSERRIGTSGRPEPDWELAPKTERNSVGPLRNLAGGNSAPGADLPPASGRRSERTSGASQSVGKAAPAGPGAPGELGRAPDEDGSGRMGLGAAEAYPVGESEAPKSNLLARARAQGRGRRPAQLGGAPGPPSSAPDDEGVTSEQRELARAQVAQQLDPAAPLGRRLKATMSAYFGQPVKIRV